MKWPVVFLVLSLVFLSCEEEKIIDQGVLTGYWILSGYQDNVTVMQRATELAEDKYGFAISPGGKFIEHRNAGWCGTPPIAYDNFEGNWTMAADSLIAINVAFWGSNTSYTMEIISLDQSTLRYRSHY